MKKFIKIMILILMFSVTNTFAEESLFRFVEAENELYYKEEAFNNDNFLNYSEIAPNKKYSNKFTVENATKENYTLYLKNEVSDDKTYENIILKIKVGNTVVYEGAASGLNYNSKNINLKYTIKLGEFASKSSENVEIEARLKDTSKSAKTLKNIKIDWSIYGQKGNSIPTKIEKQEEIEYIYAIGDVNEQTTALSSSDIPYYVLIVAIYSTVAVLFVIIGKRIKKGIEEDNISVDELRLEMPKISFKKTIGPNDDIFQIDSSLPNEDGNVRLKLSSERISELEPGDIASLYYRNKKYEYKVLDKYITKKDGYVEVDKQSKCNTLSIINANDITKEVELVVILYIVGRQEI